MSGNVLVAIGALDAGGSISYGFRRTVTRQLRSRADDLLVTLDSTAGDRAAALTLMHGGGVEWLAEERQGRRDAGAAGLPMAANASEYIARAAEHPDAGFAILHTPGGWLYWRTGTRREERLFGMAHRLAGRCGVEAEAGLAALRGIERLDRRAGGEARAVARASAAAAGATLSTTSCCGRPVRREAIGRLRTVDGVSVQTAQRILIRATRRRGTRALCRDLKAARQLAMALEHHAVRYGRAEAGQALWLPGSPVWRERGQEIIDALERELERAAAVAGSCSAAMDAVAAGARAPRRTGARLRKSARAQGSAVARMARESERLVLPGGAVPTSLRRAWQELRTDANAVAEAMEIEMLHSSSGKMLESASRLLREAARARAAAGIAVAAI